MNIRKYQSKDCNEIIQLFYNTVHCINAKDYTESQLDVWASKVVDKDAWDKSLTDHYTVICEQNKIIVGFGDIDDTGYKVVKKQQVQRCEEILINFIMEKYLQAQ